MTQVLVKTQGMKEFQRRMNKMNKRISNAKPGFRLASLLMFKDVQDHFKKEQGNKGRWRKLKKATLARRRKEGRGGRILQDNGDLRGSIRFRATKNDAEVFTNWPYAATHNFGDSRRGIPKRRFMWLSDRSRTKAVDSLGNWYTKGRR